MIKASCHVGVSGLRILTFLGIFLFMTACNVKKYIPDDKLFFEGSTLEMDTIGEIQDYKDIKYVLEGLMAPSPNSKILGFRTGLYFHYRAATDSGWIYRFLDKRMGEEPVYLDDVDQESVKALMLNRLENRGHFQSEVASDTHQNTDRKTASITYHAKVPPYYQIETYQLEGDTSAIQQRINRYLIDSQIRIGDRFDLTMMKEERQKIEDYLKMHGYYNFNQDFLQYQADTNQYDSRKLDLFLNLKKDIPHKYMIPYRIRDVNIYSNYQTGQDSISLDTVQFNEKNYIAGESYFQPDKLNPFIQLHKGEYYSSVKSKRTSRRLGSAGAYKFVNIQFTEIDTLQRDSVGYLDANIYLSPLNKRSVRAQLQAVTKSNNFTGPSLSLTYTNRNLFGGGEVLDLTSNTGYETQLNRNKEPGLNSLQLKLTGDLVFPRVLLPFPIINDWFEYSIPKTRINLAGEFISRTNLFSMSSVTSSYGFLWSGNRFVSHELNPISIIYLNLLKSTPEFDNILDRNPFLESSFEQQFISGLNYSYTYNGMVDLQKKHQFFLNGNFDIAGNLLKLITLNQNSQPQTFLGLEYAQYAKMAMDFRYHINLGNNQKLASRIFAGAGEAYGNSEVLPYSKQFYSGGPYSVRSFNARKLGPGTYNYDVSQDEDATYFDRTGNLKFEINMEYRFPIYSYLRGAIFLDAGNVWITKENNSLPGGLFGPNFLHELGIGAGIGLRLDIQSFVIRVDLAAPLHDPGQLPGSRWINDFENPVLNLAVGYPF